MILKGAKTAAAITPAGTAFSLFEPTLKAATSITTHVLDALRMPLVRLEQTTTTQRKGREVVQRAGVAVPAWAAIVGAWFYLNATTPPANRPVSDNPWISLFGGLTGPFYKLAGQ